MMTLGRGFAVAVDGGGVGVVRQPAPDRQTEDTFDLMTGVGLALSDDDHRHVGSGVELFVVLLQGREMHTHGCQITQARACDHEHDLSNRQKRRGHATAKTTDVDDRVNLTLVKSVQGWRQRSPDRRKNRSRPRM